jgi:hypothetical protein
MRDTPHVDVPMASLFLMISILRQAREANTLDHRSALRIEQQFEQKNVATDIRQSDHNLGTCSTNTILTLQVNCF